MDKFLTKIGMVGSWILVFFCLIGIIKPFSTILLAVGCACGWTLVWIHEREIDRLKAELESFYIRIKE
jgi:hypothetical protein